MEKVQSFDDSSVVTVDSKGLTISYPVTQAGPKFLIAKGKDAGALLLCKACRHLSRNPSDAKHRFCPKCRQFLDTCPACGMHCKEPGKSLCPRCYRRLPARLKAALYLRIEEGYETAMAQSLRRLHRSRFILPDEGPRRVGQLGLLPGPVGTALGRSFRSDLCPKCAGGKRPGARCARIAGWRCARRSPGRSCSPGRCDSRRRCSSEIPGNSPPT